jgi:hypothetical protein
MFSTSIIVAALASTALVNAAPIAVAERADQPKDWTTGYLEDYDVCKYLKTYMSCADEIRPHSIPRPRLQGPAQHDLL